MLREHLFGSDSATARQEENTWGQIAWRALAAIHRLFARAWCGIHGHLILLHFEPNKLSLQCGLCGYASEGWEVGRPMTSRREADNRQARRGPERRRTLRPLPTSARLAS